MEELAKQFEQIAQGFRERREAAKERFDESCRKATDVFGKDSAAAMEHDLMQDLIKAFEGAAKAIREKIS